MRCIKIKEFTPGMHPKQEVDHRYVFISNSWLQASTNSAHHCPWVYDIISAGTDSINLDSQPLEPVFLDLGKFGMTTISFGVVHNIP